MNLRRLLLCIASLLAACQLLRAEVLKGRVVDAETREPLSGAPVQIKDVIPDFCTMETTLAADSAGVFHYETSAGNIITITAKYFGYHDKSVKRIGIGGNDTIDVGNIALKPSEILMKEVTITARAKRFTMRGDTVVFNPEAFGDVEDGDRLIKLVEKLPGVSIKDGKLLWNGEPLKMMMNGQDALSQDMMLNLLPVEAVDKIKAYDRTSELQDRTGVADGREEHVLDVVVKPGFMEKFVSEVEAKAYAGREYAAELKSTKISDDNPFMLYARVADDPQKVMMMTMGSQASSQGSMPIRQQMGALGYRHAWTPDHKTYRRSRWDITAGANHSDETNESWEHRQVFLPGTTPTLSQSDSRDYAHNLTVPLDFASYLNLGTQNTLWINANVSYVRDRKENTRRQETSETEGEMALVNTSDYQSVNREEKMEMRAEATLTHHFKGGSVSANIGANYEQGEAEGSSVAEYRYLLSGENTTDRQTFSAPNHDLTSRLALSLDKAFGKNWMTSATWRTAYENKYRDEERRRNEILDTENSTYRKDGNWVNSLTLDANGKVGALTIHPWLELKHRHERTTYRRAALDTLAGRNLLLVRPELELHYRFKSQMGLKGTVSYNNMPADMIDCIGFTDNTNPLYVVMGNPNLKTAHTLDAKLLYTMMLVKHCQSLSVAANYSKTYDPIGTVMHYNSLTGGYRVQKRNVRGGWLWGGKVAYDRDLTDNLQLSNTVQGDYHRSFGIMTLVDDATGLTYNRQSQTSLTEELTLKYDCGPWYADTRHRFSWRHYTYTDAGQLVNNLYRYRAEVNGSYKLNHWKFSLEPCYILDRGYTSRYMNGGQFLLNARINFTFLKNRAELELNANDLLDQEKWYAEEITATSHTENWDKSLGRYVSLTFTYRFDPKANKK